MHVLMLCYTALSCIHFKWILYALLYIRFHKATYQALMPEIDEFNNYNCEFYTFSVKSNNIILFPSSLTHSVPTKKHDNTRISLAFNTFITGTLSATDTRLKQLIIPSK